MIAETGTGFDPRYLAAKKSIDDRALNRHVWEILRRTLPQAAGGEPVKILEIGAGIGAMLQRVVDWGLLKGPVTYMATDSDPALVRAAGHTLAQWAERTGHAWSGAGRLRTAMADVSLILSHVSAEELADRPDSLGPFHLLMAHAVLDLIDFPDVLPHLLARLTPGGLAYLTCNFDGETVFLPECKGEGEIMGLYHASMEERLSGASHTGRRLLSFLQARGLEILAAGSSDWVIHPRRAGYSGEESFFLHAIIDMVERELAENVGPPPGLAAWARLRRRQVEACGLSFLARHLDILARRNPSKP